jgi:hypothetical protein
MSLSVSYIALVAKQHEIEELKRLKRLVSSRWYYGTHDSCSAAGARRLQYLSGFSG